MNYLKPLFLILLLLSPSFSKNVINYLEPSPDSKYVNVENNIIIGFENRFKADNGAFLNYIIVTGTKSGVHSGSLVISEDAKKIIFTPHSPFLYGEKVTVKIKRELFKNINAEISEYEYSFYTSSQKVYADPLKSTMDLLGPVPLFERGNELFAHPQLTVTVNNNPSDGSVFISSYTTPSYLIITDKNGITYWNREINSLTFDFKKQPNGHLTYYDSEEVKHYELDEYYNVIDSFYCGNGYSTDCHELRVLANGHAYVMAYDWQVVDMSQIVPNGNPQAFVSGLIIQEIDENKNVVFQWRSWDHMAITDALHENLTALFIDAVHGNAIEVESDGNILISSRHLDEITKINRTTGEIIWRLGGLQNQFTFTNDTLRFTYQHAVRRTENGNITIFDNGNFHTPRFSRVIEYSLDEINKTATLVWEYRRNPSVFSSFMGYAERLNGGNTIIGWGGANPTVTEITPEGTVVFEMTFPAQTYSYRAYKFDWDNPLTVNNGENKIPADFKLYQNYPNPFNPSTHINYEIPKAAFVELSIFDITGRKLKNLISEFKRPGSYTTSFDGTQYSSGLYIYRMKTEDFTVSQKMILLK